MKENYPKFLSNQAIGEDLFLGHSQEKTADVIINDIKNSEFGIIGIDGGWGSGKTNLVKIIKKKLSVNKFSFFIYDVWGHQEDEQRRSILEELTQFISSNKLVDEKKWDKKLKKLLAKTKETNTQKKPILSLGIIISLVSLLLIPFLKSVGDNITSSWKYLVYLSPFLILLFSYLYFFFKFFKDENPYIKAGNELFKLYQKDKIEVTTYETISEEEPSVKKFREWMNDINSDLKENKLVLVFDNFDRLPKDKILQLWSSIHVFFSENKYENIKVIIPFDREHIRNAFIDLNSKEEKEEFGNSYSEDYINKTFDVVYRVAPPILTDWKGFFEEKWKQCFGEDYNVNEFTRTRQVYELLNNKITPREIIVLINEIATLKVLHNFIIPANYLALFVINKPIILKNPIPEITNPTYLKGLEFIYKNDENLPKYITSIVYQLEPENSLEIIYSEKLKDALLNKKVDELKEISEAKFFTEILEGVYPEIPKDYFPNLILSLDVIPEERFVPTEKHKIVWSDIIKSSYELENITHNLQDYQKVILKRILDIEKQKSYIRKITKEFEYEKDWNSLNYSKNIDLLQKYLDENKIEIQVSDLLENNETDSVEDFIKLLRNKKDDYPLYKIDYDVDNLDTYLSELEIDDLKDIDYLKYLDIEYYGLESFKKRLDNFLVDYKSNNDYLKTILNLLKNFKGVIDTKTISDSELYARFNSLNESNDLYYDIVAIRLSRTSSLSGHSSYFTAATNKEDLVFVKNIASRIQNYISYGDFILKANEMYTLPLYKKVAQEICVTKTGRELSLSKVLPEFENICQKSLIKPEDLINDLNRWGSGNLSIDIINSLSNYFFENAIKIHNRLTEKCISLKKEYYDNLSKEKWIEIFSDFDSEEFKLLEILGYNNWSSNSLEAMKSVLVDKAENFDSDLIKTQDTFEKIIESMIKKGHKFKSTFDTVRDTFIKNNNISNDSFYFFGNWLFKYAKLNTEGVMRTIFISDLLEDEDSLDILKDNYKEINKIISFSEDESQDFKNAIIEKSKNNADVKTLANLLGLIKEKKDK
jgi:hypothetical protein